MEDLERGGIKAVPGRKTDMNDAMWIADLAAHGLIKASFVPEEDRHDLRTLTRTRKQLVREQTRHVQRIQKTPTEANIRLDSVLSDIMGASGRRMIEARRGRIINTASQFSFRVVPGMGPYSIAKAGVVMLTRALAQELGSRGIRVNAIAPGMVKTDFSKDAWVNPDYVKQYSAQMPLGRMGETMDLAGAALFLASDASAYVTGHTIVIDGGALA